MMQLVDIQRVLRQIRYKGSRLIFSVQEVMYIDGEKAGYDVMVRINVKERTTGKDDYVYTHYVFGPAEVPYITPARIIHKVRTMLHFLETHESDEQLLYRGRRVFDPHRSNLTGPYIVREKRVMAERLEKVKTEVARQMNNYKSKQQVKRH